MKNILIIILTIGLTGYSIIARIQTGVDLVRPVETTHPHAIQSTVIQNAVIMPSATHSPEVEFTGRMCAGATCPATKPALVFPATHTPTPME
jgi:hypothetical protein